MGTRFFQHRKPSLVLRDDLRAGIREVGGRPKREGICIHVADSFHCTAEANTTL